MKIKNLLKQIRIVARHRREVRKLCFKCGLIKQGLLHDLSKYSPSELWVSAKYYCGTHSPTENELKEKGYSGVWLHHKGRNKHHFEYWQDNTHGLPTIQMPLKYVAEMFCDRVAACKIYQGNKYTDSSALEYFKSKPHEKAMIHPETHNVLANWLLFLPVWGEEKTCQHIKSVLKHQ